MKLTIQKAAALLLLFILNSQLCIVRAQGTAFTYQGRLNDGGNPASGIYDLRFTIYDSTNNPGNVIAGPITNVAATVGNGLFTVTLDFGAGVFTGPARWLQVDVRTNGGGDFTALLPRQPLMATPYAMVAGTIIPGGIPAGVYTNAIIFNNVGNRFFGNGGGLTNLNASTFTSGTLPLASLPGAVVTNQLLLTINPNSPTNMYFVTGCPDPTFNGVYSGGYITNGVGFLTNPYGRWLCEYGLAGANGSALQSNNVFDLSGSSNWYDTAAGSSLLPNNSDWESSTTFQTFPLMACYGFMSGVGTPQLTASMVNVSNLTASFSLVTVGTNAQFGTTLGEDGSVWVAAIMPTGVPASVGNNYQNVFALNADTINSIGVAHRMFEEWKADTNNNVAVLYGIRARPEWQTRIGSPYFLSGYRNDDGQWLFGWISRREGYITMDTHPPVSHGWLNVYGQDSTTNSSGIWLDIGGLSSNAIPGNVQFSGKFYLTQTNAGTTNTLPVVVNGQDTPIVLTNAGGFTAGSSGVFTGNGSGLTNVNASSLVGSLSTATLPGITTNVSNGGITFYITNGLIMRVSSP